MGLADSSVEYRILVNRLGDRASDFFSAYTNSFTYDALRPMRLLRLPLGELPQVRPWIDIVSHLGLRCPQIVFTLRAVQQPLSIPVSLASLHLVQGVSQSFMGSVKALLERTGSMSNGWSALRQLHEAGNIANIVADGTTPFPENAQSIRDGIAVEFRYFIDFLQIFWHLFHVPRNVSFQYPGSEEYALRNISFRVNPGQLCVRLNI